MALEDKELQTILNSGEVTSIYLGGTAGGNKVVTQEEVELSILAVGTVVPLTEQTLVGGVAEKLVWLETETIKIGTDLSYSTTNDEINIITSGVYKIAGTHLLEAPNGNELDFCLRINGVVKPLCATATGRGTGKTASISTQGAMILSAADVLTIWVESTGTSLTIQGSSVIIEKIG